MWAAQRVGSEGYDSVEHTGTRVTPSLAHRERITQRVPEVGVGARASTARLIRRRPGGQQEGAGRWAAHGSADATDFTWS